MKNFLVFLCLAILATGSLAAQTLEKTNCFDYYKFGSVQADIASGISTATAGSPMHFDVKVSNNNSYPIVDGSLYVKIFRKEEDPDKAHGNGHDVVGQFFAAENISLGAGKSDEVGFEWKVPLYAIPGKYYAATFFATEKKFNLLGLSFTDDIAGNTFEFEVKNELKGGVRFLKDSVKISDGANDFNYNFAAFTPKMKKDGPIVVETEIVNGTGARQDVQLTWKLYNWDSLDGKNLVESKEEKISVKPGEKLKLYYSVKDSRFPVYLLVADAKYKDSDSILNIRFVREGIDGPRLNFPSILKFPIRQGEKNSVFACMHNSGTNELVRDGKLELELTDGSGKPIQGYASDTNITGGMMALKTDFVPKFSSDNFTLRANLYAGGKIADSATIGYDCKKIRGGECLNEAKIYTDAKPAQSSGQDGNALIALGAVCAIIIIGFLYFLLSRRKPGNALHSMLLFLVLGSMFLAMPYAHAKSDTWNQTVNAELDYYWDRFGISWKSPEQWEPALENPNVTITYEVRVKDKATGTIVPEGSLVAAGTVLVFEALPLEDTDISWVGTGYSSDSPYGHWGNPDTVPAIECKTNDYVTRVTDYGMDLDVYIPLIVSAPSVDITHESGPGQANLSCGTVEGGRQECTVVSPGAIKSAFRFGTARGKFYYRYYDFRNDGRLGLSPGCYGNAQPLRVNQYVTYVDRYCDLFDDCVDYFTYNRIDFQDDYSYNYDYTTGQGSYCKWGTGQCLSWFEYVNLPRRSDYTYELLRVDHVQDTPFVLNVPEKSVEYNLIATGRNSPPAAPQITGPAQGITNSANSYNLLSTDPDGDTIRYGIDWDSTDNDNTVNEWVPATGHINSGTAQTAGHMWNAAGAKSFRALAEDNAGQKSAWTAYSTLISQPLAADAGPDYTSTQNIPINLAGGASGGSGSYSGWNWSLPALLNCIASPNTTSRSPSVTCQNAGAGSAMLTVTDSAGTTATDTAQITIMPAPSCTINDTTGTKEKIPKATTVTYTNFAQNPQANAASTFDCGNGITSQMACTSNGNTAPFAGTCTANCTYSTPGTFTQEAAVNGDAAGTEKADCGTRQINVAANPITNCTTPGAFCTSSCGGPSQQIVAGDFCDDLAGATICCKPVQIQDGCAAGAICQTACNANQAQDPADGTCNIGGGSVCCISTISPPQCTSPNSCQDSATCANPVAGFACAGGQVCCAQTTPNQVPQNPGLKNMVAISILLDKDRYKVGNDGQIIPTITITRMDSAVAQAEYVLQIKKGADNYIQIKTEIVQFAPNQNSQTITIDERQLLGLAPTGNLDPGLYIVTVYLKGTYAGETIKSDNSDSKTALVWQYQKTQSPETGPILIILTALAILTIISKK